MAYEIKYQNGLHKRKPIYPGISISKLGMISIFLIVGISLISLQGWEVLQQLVHPLGDVSTMTALDHLVENVRSGEPLYDSVMVFCQQVLEYANPVS